MHYRLIKHICARSLTRAAPRGGKAYAQTWSGDNFTSWRSLRFNLRTGLNMGLSGMFNIGHDVGGFAGPSPDGELLVRWLQVRSRWIVVWSRVYNPRRMLG